MKTLYVGNLSYTATEDELREYFSAHGRVLSAKIINDRETGRSRGFGFVEMEDADADNAVQQTDGAMMNGRPLRVNEARERSPRPPRRDRY